MPFPHGDSVTKVKARKVMLIPAEWGRGSCWPLGGAKRRVLDIIAKSVIDKVKPFSLQSLFAPSQKSMGNGRQTLQVLQASAGNTDVNRPVQVCSDLSLNISNHAGPRQASKPSVRLSKMGKVIPKRKQWSAAQPRGPKRVKVEVKSTQTDAPQCLTDGMTTEAYDLMVKGKWLS